MEIETFKNNLKQLEIFLKSLQTFFEIEYFDEIEKIYSTLKRNFGKRLNRPMLENGIKKELHKTKFYSSYRFLKPFIILDRSRLKTGEIILDKEKIIIESKYHSSRKAKNWALKIAEKLYKAKIVLYEYEKAKILKIEGRSFAGIRKAIIVHAKFYEHKILLVQDTIKNRSANNTRFDQHKCFVFMNGKKISTKELHLFMDLYEDININKK